jgi:hypothetical protein
MKIKLGVYESKNHTAYAYVYKAEHTCKKPPYLLLVIKSKVTHFENREVIRNSWAQLDEFGHIKRVFTLGMSYAHETDIIASVKAENARYGDIVQQDFVDYYYNNTIKTLMSFQWVIENCFQVI